jgi:LytS/YehU family sensor histidine kinase
VAVLVITSLAIGGMGALGIYICRVLWAQPSRRLLNLATLGTLFLGGLAAGLVVSLNERHQWLTAKQAGAIFGASGLVVIMVGAGWYFLTMYRAQQVESRLRERDAQDARESLQRRLATAQIHPHFVFNTLASLTHWVESGDARAAPLLKEFNAYLRATLPMFEREQQPLREELDLVRHYLAIMQARMGERLQWTVQADPALAELALPPGSLLTLAENAITHGIEPALRGGRIELQLQRDGALARIVVADSGAGLDDAVTEGLGLSNTRERLLALHPGARLLLTGNENGGCTATMEIPLP